MLSILTFVSFSVETIVKDSNIFSVASLLVKRLSKLHPWFDSQAIALNYSHPQRD